MKLFVACLIAILLLLLVVPSSAAASHVRACAAMVNAPCQKKWRSLRVLEHRLEKLQWRWVRRHW